MNESSDDQRSPDGRKDEKKPSKAQQRKERLDRLSKPVKRENQPQTSNAVYRNIYGGFPPLERADRSLRRKPSSEIKIAMIKDVDGEEEAEIHERKTEEMIKAMAEGQRLIQTRTSTETEKFTVLDPTTTEYLRKGVVDILQMVKDKTAAKESIKEFTKNVARRAKRGARSHLEHTTRIRSAIIKKQDEASKESSRHGSRSRDPVIPRLAVVPTGGRPSRSGRSKRLPALPVRGKGLSTRKSVDSDRLEEIKQASIKKFLEKNSRGRPADVFKSRSRTSLSRAKEAWDSDRFFRPFKMTSSRLLDQRDERSRSRKAEKSKRQRKSRTDRLFESLADDRSKSRDHSPLSARAKDRMDKAFDKSVRNIRSMLKKYEQEQKPSKRLGKAIRGDGRSSFKSPSSRETKPGTSAVDRVESVAKRQSASLKRFLDLKKSKDGRMHSTPKIKLPSKQKEPSQRERKAYERSISWKKKGLASRQPEPPNKLPRRKRSLSHLEISIPKLDRRAKPARSREAVSQRQRQAERKFLNLKAPKTATQPQRAERSVMKPKDMETFQRRKREAIERKISLIKKGTSSRQPEEEKSKRLRTTKYKNVRSSIPKSEPPTTTVASKSKSVTTRQKEAEEKFLSLKRSKPVLEPSRPKMAKALSANWERIRKREKDAKEKSIAALRRGSASRKPVEKPSLLRRKKFHQVKSSIPKRDASKSDTVTDRTESVAKRQAASLKSFYNLKKDKEVPKSAKKLSAKIPIPASVRERAVRAYEKSISMLRKTFGREPEKEVSKRDKDITKTKRLSEKTSDTGKLKSRQTDAYQKSISRVSRASSRAPTEKRLPRIKRKTSGIAVKSSIPKAVSVQKKSDKDAKEAVAQRQRLAEDTFYKSKIRSKEPSVPEMSKTSTAQKPNWARLRKRTREAYEKSISKRQKTTEKTASETKPSKKDMKVDKKSLKKRTDDAYQRAVTARERATRKKDEALAMSSVKVKRDRSTVDERARVNKERLKRVAERQKKSIEKSMGIHQRPSERHLAFGRPVPTKEARRKKLPTEAKARKLTTAPDAPEPDDGGNSSDQSDKSDNDFDKLNRLKDKMKDFSDFDEATKMVAELQINQVTTYLETFGAITRAIEKHRKNRKTPHYVPALKVSRGLSKMFHERMYFVIECLQKLEDTEMHPKEIDDILTNAMTIGDQMRDIVGALLWQVNIGKIMECRQAIQYIRNCHVFAYFSSTDSSKLKECLKVLYSCQMFFVGEANLAEDGLSLEEFFQKANSNYERLARIRSDLEAQTGQALMKKSADTKFVDSDKHFLEGFKLKKTKEKETIETTKQTSQRKDREKTTKKMGFPREIASTRKSTPKIGPKDLRQKSRVKPHIAVTTSKIPRKDMATIPVKQIQIPSAESIKNVLPDPLKFLKKKLKDPMDLYSWEERMVNRLYRQRKPKPKVYEKLFKEMPDASIPRRSVERRAATEPATRTNRQRKEVGEIEGEDYYKMDLGVPFQKKQIGKTTRLVQEFADEQEKRFEDFEKILRDYGRDIPYNADAMDLVRNAKPGIEDKVSRVKKALKEVMAGKELTESANEKMRLADETAEELREAVSEVISTVIELECLKSVDEFKRCRMFAFAKRVPGMEYAKLIDYFTKCQAFFEEYLLLPQRGDDFEDFYQRATKIYRNSRKLLRLLQSEKAINTTEQPIKENIQPTTAFLDMLKKMAGKRPVVKSRVLLKGLGSKLKGKSRIRKPNIQPTKKQAEKKRPETSKKKAKKPEELDETATIRPSSPVMDTTDMVLKAAKKIGTVDDTGFPTKEKQVILQSKIHLEYMYLHQELTGFVVETRAKMSKEFRMVFKKWYSPNVDGILTIVEAVLGTTRDLMIECLRRADAVAQTGNVLDLEREVQRATFTRILARREVEKCEKRLQIETDRYLGSFYEKELSRNVKRYFATVLELKDLALSRMPANQGDQALDEPISLLCREAWQKKLVFDKFLSEISDPIRGSKRVANVHKIDEVFLKIIDDMKSFVAQMSN